MLELELSLSKFITVVITVSARNDHLKIVLGAPALSEAVAHLVFWMYGFWEILPVNT